MKEVKALAVMTRPELEQALADVNVTRRLQHKLLELQQAQIAELREALAVLSSDCLRWMGAGSFPVLCRPRVASHRLALSALAATEPRT